MGQGEIIKLLQNSCEPLSSRQIAEALCISNVGVCTLLSKLLKYKEIKFIEINHLEAKKRFDYGVSRRMRLYYID